MAERLKNYNVIASVRFNGQLIDGLVAVFDVEDEDWVTVAIDVEAEPGIGTTMSVRVDDLKRLLEGAAGKVEA